MSKLALINQPKNLSSIFNDFFESDSFENFFNDSWLPSNWITFSEIKNQSIAKYSFDKETREYSIILQTPGFLKEDINVEIDENGINISGEIKNEETKKKIGDQKLSYFKKVKNIDDKNVNAIMENGILEIKFKTKEENKILKKIEIK